MSHDAYLVIHIVSVMFVFLALGGLTLRAIGGARDKDDAARLAGLTHGIALLAVIVSGFGLLARLGIEHDWLFPPWVWGKLVVWLTLGGSIAVVRRKPQWLKALWVVLPLLGGVAAFLAVFKPGG